MNDQELRRKYVTQAKRVVVKVGSGLLTGKTGLNYRRIGILTEQIAGVKRQGRDVVLVSSGAIASGFKKIGLPERPKTVRLQAACAAIGQAGMMQIYENAFARRGFKVAQVLLTADDLTNRRRYLNARNTMTTLLDWNVIPIVNENDTVMVAELKFGDNDTLGGMVTGLIEGDLFINLTDIDGLYDSDPRSNPDAAFISTVENVGSKIESMASKIPGSLGAGGMFTKIRAAKRLSEQGVPCIIAKGSLSRILERLFEGEPIGTLFLPRDKKINSKKHWIAHTSRRQGQIIVDDGAKKALLKKNRSLLPVGVVEIKARFNTGDSVQVLDKKEKVVAVGLTNYSSDELTRIIGRHAGEIEKILGYKHSDEVIDGHNMVVGDDLPD